MKVRDLDLQLRQGAILWFTKEMQRIAWWYKGLTKDRTLAKLYIEIANFHHTVLETYWELEARTGTKMTARNCTFSLWSLFLVQKYFYSNFFIKTV